MARLPCLRLCAVIRLNPRIVACRETGRLSGSAANIGSKQLADLFHDTLKDIYFAQV
jgi:hypothetical protein